MTRQGFYDRRLTWMVVLAAIVILLASIGVAEAQVTVREGRLFTVEVPSGADPDLVRMTYDPTIIEHVRTRSGAWTFRALAPGTTILVIVNFVHAPTVVRISLDVIVNAKDYQFATHTCRLCVYKVTKTVTLRPWNRMSDRR